VYKKFTKEIDARIEKLLGTKPDYGTNPKTYQPNPSRR